MGNKQSRVSGSGRQLDENLHALIVVDEVLDRGESVDENSLRKLLTTDEPPSEIQHLIGLSLLCNSRAEYQQAIEHAENALQAAAKEHITLAQMDALVSLSDSLEYLGRLSEAHSRVHQGLQLLAGFFRSWILPVKWP